MSSLVKQFVVTIYLEGDAAKRLRLNADVPQVAEKILLEKFPEASVEVVEPEGHWYDQYGGIVPFGVTVLPPPGDDLGVDEIKAMDKVDWWEVLHPDIPRLLVVSTVQLAEAGVFYDDASLADQIGGADYYDLRFMKVAEGLKRYSEADGFYHA